jgi:hypothetical protein
LWQERFVKHQLPEMVSDTRWRTLSLLR